MSGRGVGGFCGVVLENPAFRALTFVGGFGRDGFLASRPSVEFLRAVGTVTAFAFLRGVLFALLRATVFGFALVGRFREPLAAGAVLFLTGFRAAGRFPGVIPATGFFHRRVVAWSHGRPVGF